MKETCMVMIIKDFSLYPRKIHIVIRGEAFQFKRSNLDIIIIYVIYVSI